MNPSRTSGGRRAARRLLAAAVLSVGVIAGTTVPASAAVTATFNAGTLTVFGDSLDNSITDQPQCGRHRSWSTAARSPSPVARRRSPTPR